MDHHIKFFMMPRFLRASTEIVLFAFENSCHLISTYVKDVFGTATDSTESYALILTDYGLLTFTEDNGFKYEGFFWTNSTDLRDLDSVPSDSFSFDSNLSLRPYFTLSKSSLFRIG